MEVRVKLFATLRHNRQKESILDIEENTSIADIIGRLEIPEQEAAIIMVNGRHAGPDRILKDGDTLSLFPPLGGG